MGAPATRSSRRYRKLVANLRALRHPCHICGDPIDYNLEYPDPRSFSADHIRPFSTHPHLREDPSNLEAAHLECNRGNPSGAPVPHDPQPLGPGSRDW